MYHLHQPWTDIEAMPIYERRWITKRLMKALEKK